jgi:MSHA biogenesis protein MshQ
MKQSNPILWNGRYAHRSWLHGSWLRRALLLAAVLLCGQPALAQVARVQSSGLFGNPAGITATSSPFAANPTIGNTIVVLVWTWTENNAPATAVTDSAGNIYTQATQAVINQSGWFESASIFYAPVTATGAGLTVTVNMPGNDGASQSRVVALEYAGVGALDQATATTGTSAAAQVSTPAAVAMANELVVSSFGIDNPAANFGSITPSSGFTTQGIELQNAGDTAGGAADNIAGTTGIQSITWTTNPTLSGWAAAIATFKPAVSVPPASRWHFDESSWPATAGAVIDSGGGGYNGTAMHGASTASTTSAITGNPGTCGYGSLNGTTQYVAVSGPHLSGQFTVTAWIKPTATDSTGGRIWYDDTNDNGYAVSYGDSGVTNTLRFYIRNPSTTWAEGNMTLTTGNWYFVAAVLDAITAKTITLYTFNAAGNLIDQSSVPISGFTPSNSTLLGIGGATDASIEGSQTQRRFPGSIDEVTTYTKPLSLTQLKLAAIQTHACSSLAAPGPDHYAISDAGIAVNCQASPVTITAHTATHAPMATTDTITVSTSTGHGDWSLGTGGGGFTPGAPNSGTATYSYVVTDAGSVTLLLKDTYPETVSINVIDGSATQSSGSAIASEQPPLTFVASGFRFTNGANVATSIGTQVAGKTSTQSLALQAIRTDTNTGACTAVFASGATVNVSLAYQCNNPASCIAGQTLGITNNGTTTPIAANPAAGVSSYTTVPLTFSTPNAEAPFSLNYSDAGQITLYARYSIPLGSGAGSANTMAGAGQFVVQPAGFTVSNIRCTNYGAGTCAASLAAPGFNPGAGSAAGAAFIPAGQPFSATVTAVNFGGAPTPNFGQELAPAGLTLTANLVAPVGGDAAALNNAGSFGAFSGGGATGVAFNWPEVGIITLTPGIANYLGSGAVTGLASGNVGRFYPNDFAVALNTPVFGTGCSAGSFSYVGQPLTYTVAPVMTVTAQALGGITTRNYTGAFLKLSNVSLTGRTYTPTPAAPALDLSGLPPAGIDPVIADLGTGQATLTFSAGSGLQFTRGAPSAPFNANISLSLNVLDTDGVAGPNPVTFGTGPGISFSTSPAQWYGQLALRNAVGSELLDLPMSLTTQYYLGAAQGFTLNTADSCTTAPPLAFSNYQLNLSAGQTCVRDTGKPGVSGLGCTTPAALASQYRATAAAGNFNLNLAAPGAGNSGAVTVTATAPPWLIYPAGSGVNPAGMATFGVFPGPTSRVHQREVY